MMNSAFSQPSSGASGPPGEETGTPRRVLNFLVLAGLAALLVYLCVPQVPSHRRLADRTGVITNLKQIGLSLQEFEADYGRFPDASTIAEVKKVTGTRWELGSDSSNQLYRQMIVNGLGTEKPFYARTPWSKKPDDLFRDEAEALAPGEVGSAYIVGLSTASCPGATPVVVVPLKPGTTIFERLKYYDDKAVILRCDQSARALPIDPGGHVIDSRMDLFDPRQPYWAGKAPDIKCPEIP